MSTMSPDSAISESMSHMNIRSRSSGEGSVGLKFNKKVSKSAFKKRVSIFDNRSSAVVTPTGSDFLGEDEERRKLGAQDIMNALGIAVSLCKAIALGVYRDFQVGCQKFSQPGVFGGTFEWEIARMCWFERANF